MEPEQEGMSTTKKVAAGAAVGVAIPAAVGVAKKLMGDDSDESSGDGRGEQSRGTASRRRSPSKSSRSRRSGSTRRSSSTRTRSGSGRTKEQLYATAKRLKIEGRSKMTKTQLERAVARARG